MRALNAGHLEVGLTFLDQLGCTPAGPGEAGCEAVQTVLREAPVRCTSYITKPTLAVSGADAGAGGKARGGGAGGATWTVGGLGTCGCRSHVVCEQGLMVCVAASCLGPLSQGRGGTPAPGA